MMVATDIEIRMARQNEAGTISDILYESFAEEKDHYTKEAFEYSTPNVNSVRDRILDKTVWVTLFNNEIVATASGVQQQEIFYIRSVAVKKKARRLGLARSLMLYMEEKALHRTCKTLSLTTTSFLIPAVRLYESLGFRVAGATDLYGTTLVKMTKRL